MTKRIRAEGARRVAGALVASATAFLLMAANPQPRPVARPTAPQPGLDGLISGIGPLCLKAPARQCIDQGFVYADRDHSQGLSLAEARAVHDEVNAWAKAHAPSLAPEDRQRLVMGLLVIQTVGPDAIFQSYDANHDGQVSKAELLADVKLDNRPLPQILADPKAIDWQQLQARAGGAAPLLKRLFDF